MNAILDDIHIKEKDMDVTLTNAIYALKGFLKTRNPNPDRSEMIKWSKELSVSSLYVWSPEGKLENVATDALVSRQSFFDTYRKIDGCALEQRTVKKRDVAFLYYPVKADHVEHEHDAGHHTKKFISKTQKFVTSWHPDINKWLNADIRGIDFSDALERNINRYDVEAITLFSPNASVIALAEKEGFVSDGVELNFKSKSKIHDVIIKEVNDYYIMSMSFEDGYVEAQDCNIFYQHLVDDVNKDDYFYNLSVAFSKKSLIQEINKLRFTYIIALFAIIIILFLMMHNLNLSQNNKVALIKHARQIHHDVASPLQALDWSIAKIIRNSDEFVSKIGMQLKQSLESIKDIMSDLCHLDTLEKEKKLTTELLYPVISSSFSSARLLVNTKDRNELLQIEKTSDFDILVDIDVPIFRRALLNLIKNAIEAGGNSIISVIKNGQNVIIKIQDNGSGMDQNTVRSLLSGNSLTNKFSGSGMGFQYSRKAIDSFKGSLFIDSTVDIGTVQTIMLPISQHKPNWFINCINLQNIDQVVILDDFIGLHDVWEEKLSRGKNIQISHLYTSDEFENFIISQDNSKKYLYLIDFSLDNILTNGIELILKYNIKDNAILVTSRYFDAFIKEECSKWNIKLLPKEFISLIDII